MPYKDPKKSKSYQREYQKRWRETNPQKWKEIIKKSEAKPERKEYVRNWQKTSPKAKSIRKRYRKSEKGKEYDKRWTKENPEKIKAKYARYYNSLKGVVNYLKKKDKKKFKISNKEITVELIKTVNERDILCVYCKENLSNIKAEYDHLNGFKPFSKINLVRCCSICNRSKGSSNVLQWCNFKGYTPLPIVHKLLKEQKD